MVVIIRRLRGFELSSSDPLDLPHYLFLFICFKCNVGWISVSCLIYYLIILSCFCSCLGTHNEYKLCTCTQSGHYLNELFKALVTLVHYHSMVYSFEGKSPPEIDTKFAIKMLSTLAQNTIFATFLHSCFLSNSWRALPRIVLCSAWMLEGFSIFRLICMGNKVEFFSVVIDQLVFNLISV